MQTKTVTILGMCISFLLIATEVFPSTRPYNAFDHGITQRLRNSESEQACLAKVVFHEARNQSMKGKIAVADVTLNRVYSDEYPDSVCVVIRQPSQYPGIKKSRVRNNAKSRKAWEDSKRAAAIAMKHRNSVLSKGVMYFHTTKARPSWRFKMVRVARIDDHIFYR